MVFQNAVALPYFELSVQAEGTNYCLTQWADSRARTEKTILFFLTALH